MLLIAGCHMHCSAASMLQLVCFGPALPIYFGPPNPQLFPTPLATAA